MTDEIQKHVDLTTLSNEELAKLLPKDFSGTLEIPIPAAPAGNPEKREEAATSAPADSVQTAEAVDSAESSENAAAQPAKQPQTAAFAEKDLSCQSAEEEELANLFWNGQGDVPYIEFGQDYVAERGEPLPAGAPIASVDAIIEAIKTVEDPELMLNVYDLGLIYRLDRMQNGDVEIDMTVTAPACPVAGVMPNQVAEAVSKVAGTGKVTVKLVWEPAWTIDRLSENAKYILDMF